MKIVKKSLNVIQNLCANKKAFISQAVGLLFMVFASAASAKLSDYGQNVVGEVGFFAKYGMYIFTVIGLFMFVFGFMEYKKAKTQNGDKSMAITSLIVGLCLGIGSLLYQQSVESVTDEQYEVNTDFK
jgi:uncharacterized membrane protein